MDAVAPSKKLLKKIKLLIASLFPELAANPRELKKLAELFENLQRKKAMTKALDTFLDEIRKGDDATVKEQIKAIIERMLASALPVIQYFEQNPQELDALVSIGLTDGNSQELETATKTLDDALENEEFSKLVHEVGSTLTQLTQVQTKIQDAKAATESGANPFVQSHQIPGPIINKELALPDLEREKQALLERVARGRKALHAHPLFSDVLKSLETIERLSNGHHQFANPRHTTLRRVCLHALMQGAFHGHPSQTTLMNLHNKKSGGPDHHPMIESR